jgi:hypothetical protein
MHLDTGDLPELNPELDDIRARLIASRATASSVAEGLSDEEFNRQPGPGEWSVCECLDHLNVVGGKLCEAFDEGLERAHREGLFGRRRSRYGFFERWFAREASVVSPPRHKRVRTFGVYEPRAGQSAANVLADYRTLQTNLIERVEAANGIDLARLKIRSPATRWVRMSMGQWLQLVAGHQERHLDQAWQARRRTVTGP